MFRKAVRIAPLALGALALALVSSLPARATEEPSAYHRYVMKGSIVEKDGSALYLCIGTHDGAEVGQELDVVRVKRAPGGGKSGIVRFERKQIGRVRIDEITDEHFARAKLLSGEAQKGDLVELRAAEH